MNISYFWIFSIRQQKRFSRLSNNDGLEHCILYFFKDKFAKTFILVLATWIVLIIHYIAIWLPVNFSTYSFVETVTLISVKLIIILNSVQCWCNLENQEIPNLCKVSWEVNESISTYQWVLLVKAFLIDWFH